MAVDVAVLGVKVDASGAITGINTVESGLGRLTKAAASLGVVLGAGAIFGKFVKETIDAQYATAQLEARIKSTGGAAGVSVAQLEDYASALQQTTEFSDDAIKSAQAMLLTFTKIKADNFNDVTVAVANLATAMGGDLQGAAIQVGKAMQGNAGSMTALQKVGIAFTNTEKDLIESHFAAGRAADAQRMILKELTVEFGGAAEAARQTLGGALKGLANDFGDIFEVTKQGTSGIVGGINALGAGIRELSQLTGGLFNIAQVVAAVYAGKLLLAMGAYGVQQRAVAVNNALIAASEVTKAEFAVAAARAQQIAATQNLALTTRAMAFNEVTAVSQMQALVGVQAANARAAVAADALAVATTRSSVAMGVATTAARTLWTAIGGPFGLAVIAFTASFTYFSKAARDAAAALSGFRGQLATAGPGALKASIAEVTAELTKLQSRVKDRTGFTGFVEDTPRVRELKATLAALEAQLKSLGAVTPPVTEATKSLLQTLNEEIAKTRELIAFNAAHIPQLMQLARLKFDEAEASEAVTSAAEKEYAIKKKIAELLSGNGPSPKVGGGLAMPTITTRIGTGSAPPSDSPFNTTELAGAADRWKTFLKNVRDEYENANKDMEQIRENFLRGTQEAFAKTFEDIFTKGIKSFGDLFSRLGDLIKQAAAQMAASGLMTALFGKKGEDGSRTGGLGALVSAHPVIAGVVALGASMVAMGARAKQAARDVEEMTKALNLSLGQYRADAGLQPKEDTAIADAKARAEKLRADVRAKAEREIDAVNANMWTTRWHKEKRAAEIWAAAQPALDKINEAERALIALREKEAAAIEAARVAQSAYNTARAMDDLKVRDLTLRGLTDEAEAQALFNAQVREFAAAVAEVNKGLLGEEFLKELSAIQERERAALAASQAAAKAAKEAEEAERALTAARETAARQLAASQDLEVEMLQAKGQTAEADQMAFDLEQQRRLEAAQKDQTAEYVAKLKELQDLQRQNRAAALAGGGVADVAQSTASNVFAGADTVTASFGTKVSAEVGDRMLDNLVSIRVILRAIEKNTRNLGGKINTSLGLSLSDNYALAGSSVLS